MSYTSAFAFCTGPTLRDMYADAPTIYPKIALMSENMQKSAVFYLAKPNTEHSMYFPSIE